MFAVVFISSEGSTGRKVYKLDEMGKIWRKGRTGQEVKLMCDASVLGG